MFIRNAITVGIITFISRILGYIRDMVIAQRLGAGIYNDIFIMAFRIPNLFRAIFGEGAFNASFVPIYSAKIIKKDDASKFVSLLHTYLLCGLILFSTLLFVFMPMLVKLTLPGFKNHDAIAIVITCSRIMLPYLVLISLVAFYGGILNCNAKYMPFAAAPIFLNLALIVFALLGDSSNKKIYFLSVGVVVAGVIELIWMLFFLQKKNLIPKFSFSKVDGDMKVFIKKFIPGIIGSGVTQINILIDSIIASYTIGGISYLYYADRINQLPLALLGTASGIVILPILSKSFKNDNKNYAIEIHNKAINFLLLATIPSALALQFLSFEIVELLFKKGAFTYQAVIQTANALKAFAFGLPAFTLIKVFVTNFYANGDTKTPVKIALCTIISNVTISLLLLNYLQHVGIALASSVSAWFSLITMWYILNKKGWFKFDLSLVSRILKYLIAGILMSIFLFTLKSNPVFNHSWMLITCAGLLYVVIIILLRAVTINEIKAFFKK